MLTSFIHFIMYFSIFHNIFSLKLIKSHLNDNEKNTFFQYAFRNYLILKNLFLYKSLFPVVMSYCTNFRSLYNLFCFLVSCLYLLVFPFLLTKTGFLPLLYAYTFIVGNSF